MVEKTKRALNEIEAKRLLEQPNRKCPTGYRNYVMMRLMLNAGLRVSECCNLQKNEVDFTMGRVFINQSKGAKDRNVWINGETVDDILKWIDWRDRLIEEGKFDDPMEVQKKGNEEKGVKNRIKNWIFITHNGTKTSKRYVWGAVMRYGKKANIEMETDTHNVTPHMLRHTFATEMLRKTNNLSKVQKALGHKNVSTTQEYIYVTDEDLEKDMKGFNITIKGEDDSNE